MILIGCKRANNDSFDYSVIVIRPYLLIRKDELLTFENLMNELVNAEQLVGFDCLQSSKKIENLYLALTNKNIKIDTKKVIDIQS